MLDVNYIRKNPEDAKRRLGYKKVDPHVIDAFLELDKKWRELTEKVDLLRAKLNTLSKERNIDEAKKTKEELNHSLVDLRAKLLKLNFDLADSKVKDFSQLRKTKQDIARILTVLKQINN